jgi:hypothetical protein
MARDRYRRTTTVQASALLRRTKKEKEGRKAAQKNKPLTRFFKKISITVLQYVKYRYVIVLHIFRNLTEDF